MTTLDQIASRIIKEQELIIGPIAWNEAEQVSGLTFNNHTSVQISESAGDPKIVVDQLVSRYERLFGRASREASKEAVAGLSAELAPRDVPSSLQIA
jgi:hypothetical protein